MCQVSESVALAMLAAMFLSGCGRDVVSIHSIEGISGGTSVAFSNDGQRLVISGRLKSGPDKKRSVVIVDTKTWEPVGDSPCAALDVTWHHDDTALFVATYDGVSVLNAGDMSSQSTIAVTQNACYGIAVDDIGRVYLGKRIDAEWDGHIGCPVLFGLTSSARSSGKTTMPIQQYSMSLLDIVEVSVMRRSGTETAMACLIGTPSWV